MPWHLQRMPGGTQWGPRREKERKKAWAWGSAFIGVRVRGLGFPGPLFIDECKIEEQNFEDLKFEVKKQVTQMVSYQNQPTSLK